MRLSAPRHRSPAVLGILVLLAALMSLWSSPASAAPAGQVLASPDPYAHPPGGKTNNPPHPRPHHRGTGHHKKGPVGP
ncbi:hypothetical protein ACFW9V_39250, partial [Streptomyces hygroscopicus]